MAVLFSMQILNSSQDFFLLNIFFSIYLFKYETIETHARAFLTLIILAIGTAVKGLTQQDPIVLGQNQQPSAVKHLG